MSILYKYCDQIGALIILGSLELKLPYISDVNDPVECTPVFYCGKNELVTQNKELEDKHRKIQEEWNRKNCLLSLSRTPKNVVMWAHYADRHKGIVIGMDFDNVFKCGNGIKMSSVTYAKERIKIDLLSQGILGKPTRFYDVLITKSDSWDYEEECRSVLLAEHLKIFQERENAILRDFNGKETWFLRLKPEMIKEVIFGLSADQGLQTTVKSLVFSKIPNVKFSQAVISKDEYNFELKPIEGA